MNYTELLNSDKWKLKCFDILLRDKFICQDCGCKGIHNNTFFPFSRIKDLNYLIPIELLDGRYLDVFLTDVTSDLKETKREPVYLSSNKFKENLYINTMITISPFEQPLHFISNTLLNSLNFKQYHRNTSEIQYNGNTLSRYVYACQLQEEMNGSWASINYSRGKWEELSVNIINEKNLYQIEYTLKAQEKLLFSCIPLNIHHNYYIYGNNPWEYDNNALVTLCASCHQKRHQKYYVPVYSKEHKLIKKKLPICDRCQGSGYLPEYHYHLGGICFKCNGEGVLL